MDAQYRNFRIVGLPEIQSLFYVVRTIAVSYTHLDVYKRQVPVRYDRGIEYLKSRGYEMIHGSLQGKQDFYRSGTIQPVSYTHLTMQSSLSHAAPITPGSL